MYKSMVGKGVIATRFTPDVDMTVVWVKEETEDAVIGHQLTLDGEKKTIFLKKDYKFFNVGEQVV